MNETLRYLLFLCLVISLSTCQVFSKGKKSNAAATSETTKKAQTTTPATSATNTANTASGNSSGARMTRAEQNMLDEVNALRISPQSYIPYIKSYMYEVKNNAAYSESYKLQELEAARELIAELSRMPPLPPLRAHLGLYQVAVAHGSDIKGQAKLSHVGKNGSYPWDRVQKSTDLTDGNENLVGGGRDARESVLILLVDSGVPGRGHRMNLLNPEWEYLACHQLNKVGRADNCWLQLFGSKPKTTAQAGSTTPATETTTAGTTIPQPYENVSKRDIYPVPVRWSNPTPTTPTNPVNSTPSSSGSGNTQVPANNTDDFSFMKQQERDMIREINLMRSNPRGYIPYVRQYLKEFKNSGWDAATVREEEQTANELIKELQQLGPLSTLKPKQDLHQVAVNHGLDLQQMGKVQHVGSDGSHPWERVRAGTSLTDGNENLVGGLPTVRESVINLLIDAGIPGRGHRKTLLEPRWEYAACYKVGNIGEMPDCWVQVFGKQ